MKVILITLFLILLMSIRPGKAQLTEYIKNYVTDEKAPGARAAMGIFAAGYGKALAESTFDFPMNTWQNRLTSIGIATVRLPDIIL